MADFENEDMEIGDTSVCPECGGNMIEDDNDPEMMQCEKCGHMASVDEAKDVDEEEIQ